MQHRTGLIAAGAIVGLVAFGSIAIGANLGVLGNAQDESFGQISAANTSVSANSNSSVSVVAQTVGSTTMTDGTVTHFDVADAGTVDLVTRDAMVAVHSVAPATGWTWTILQRDPGSLVVEFNSTATQIRFTGTRSDDGTVSGRVETHASPPKPSGNPAVPHHEDEHEGGDDDD